MATSTIRAHYQGTIGGQLRYLPALNRGTPMSLLLSGLALLFAILSLPYVYFTILGVLFSMAILSGYFIIPFAWWSMRRNRWLFEAPVDLTASESGLEFSTAAGVRKVPWEAVSEVRELKDVLAVMLRPGGGYCIPKAALKGDDLTDLRELCAEKVPFRAR